MRLHLLPMGKLSTRQSQSHQFSGLSGTTRFLWGSLATRSRGSPRFCLVNPFLPALAHFLP
eukprot:4274003-Amphidinium_carterae.1